MDEALLKKIGDDLWKAGFASELIALQRLAARDWTAFAGYHYLDADEQKEREIDINAFFDISVGSGDTGGLVATRVLADVKKSEKPWVVLKGPSAADLIDWEASQGLMGAGFNLKKKFSLMPFELYNEDCVAMKNGWIGHAVHESFKSPTDYSRSYVAFSSVCKACEAALSACEQFHETEKEPFITLIQPAIFLDGPLASVAVGGDGSLKVEPQKWAAVRFSQRSKMLSRGSYLVNVVQLNHLDEFLEMTERRLKRAFEAFKKVGYF